MCPQRLYFVQQLPRSGAGKVRRNEVVALLSSDAGALSAVDR